MAYVNRYLHVYIHRHLIAFHRYNRRLGNYEARQDKSGDYERKSPCLIGPTRYANARITGKCAHNLRYINCTKSTSMNQKGGVMASMERPNNDGENIQWK